MSGCFPAGSTRRYVVCLAALVLSAASAPARGAAARAGPDDRAETRPNVLIFITDDQRPEGTLRVMPRTKRWFLRDGTRFTNALASTPTCCPSRASVMTGLHAHNHGVHRTTQGEAEKMDQDLTLQRYLRVAGYRTGVFGKYLNWWPKHNTPPHFHDWAIFVDRAKRGFYGGRWNVRGKVRRPKRYSTRFVQSRSLGFLREAERDDDRPWLMFVAPLSPHLPATPHPSHARADVPRFERTPAMTEKDRSDKPPEVRDHRMDPRRIRQVRRDQLRSLMSVDETVDAVFRRLRDLRETRDTIAIYMSDNGFLWGEHGLFLKTRPYAASAGIPFFVRWPGHVERRGLDDRLVTNVDVAPSILDAVGVEPGHTFDGRSFFDEGERDRALLENWYRVGREVPNWAALRARDYLYVEHYGEERLVPTYREYYDLREDPWELHNLLGDASPANDPGDAAELSLQLHRDVQCAGTSGTTACP